MRYNVDHKEKMMGVRFTEECWQDLEYLSKTWEVPRARVIREAGKIVAKNVRLDEGIRAEAMTWR